MIRKAKPEEALPSLILGTMFTNMFIFVGVYLLINSNLFGMTIGTAGVIFGEITLIGIWFRHYPNYKKSRH